jgi:hypothetical protein
MKNKKRQTEDSKETKRKRKRHNDWDFRHKKSDSFRNNYVASFVAINGIITYVSFRSLLCRLAQKKGR